MLIYSIILLLLSNAINNRWDRSTLYFKTSTILLIYTSLILLSNLYNEFNNNGISLFGGLFFFNYYTLTFIFLIILITIIIIGMISFHPLKSINSNFSFKSLYKDDETKKINEQQKLSEYSLIILFCVTGGIFLMLSSDIISVFLSIELQSYALYLLCTIYRNSENSVTAGLTYFLLGGLSSCIILLGQSLLYLNTGNTSLENIYIIKNIYDTLYSNNIIENYNIFWESIQYSLIVMSVGFLFKISAAPFHFWSPDVYDAIPTIVTTFVAIIAKISILIFLLEIVYYTSSNFTQVTWINNLLISSILSLIIGSVLGLVQHRIKRLYAYSTISHLGFLLLALSINNSESIHAFLFYLIQYSISNLNAFMILIAIGYTLYNYEWQDKTISYRSIYDINNSPIQLIAQLKGYFWINPTLSLSLVITLFSFIGVPPLIGFFGKQMILTAAINNGFIFITFIAIITSVISAVYYLFVVKTIFSEEKIYKYNNYLSYNTLSSSISLPISLITLFIIVFIINNDTLGYI
jgi:NADH-ubiquinone oxidoreductase chain 2